MGEVRTRISLYNKLVKFLDQVKQHETKPLTLDEATTLMERCETTFDNCEASHDKIVRLCASDEDVAVQEVAFEPIEKIYQELKSKLKTIIRAVTPAPTPTPTSTSQQSGSTSTPKLNINLPAIGLPSFDGNYVNWPSFKDLFTAIVASNGQLAPSQKLQYLKSALSNEPAALIKALTITDSNYDEAWKMLTERYDNQREIVHSLINKLLFYKPILNESAADLQKLIDNVAECLSALKVLSQPIENWDCFLVVLIVNKLDPQTRREWAIRLTGSDLPTYKELSTFITNHIRGLHATGILEKKPKFEKPERGIKSHHSTAEPTCVICKGNHHHYRCQELSSKSPADRITVVKQHKLCFNCLNRDHRSIDCKSKSTCKKCNRRHHSLLHLEKATTPTTTTAPAQLTQPPQQPVAGVSSNHTNIETQVLLSTAIVRVRDAMGNMQVCRLFLDSGSQGTFITEKCASYLGLKRRHSSVAVTGISSTSAGVTKGKVNLTLHNHFNPSLSIQIEAHVLPKVTGDQPKQKCKIQDWIELQQLPLADPQYHTPGHIDILIGADYCAEILQDGRRTGPHHTPIAQWSLFGWVLSGMVEINSCHTINSFHVDLDGLLRRFWEIEDIPSQPTLTKEEKICEQHFIDNLTRNSTGRFVVAVPFNNKVNQLGLSRQAAVKRLQQVEKRLNGKPELQQQYFDFMREYRDLGHMVRVPPQEHTEVAGKTNYLPHHYVTNESSTTTKLRVVFDGSYKTTTGLSLNDTLYVGATVQKDLTDLLLCFRLHAVVLKADVAKMFRQFQLRNGDMDYHRIVWRDNPQDPIVDYQLCTVTYGTACANFLATRCINQLAKDSTLTYPAAAHALEHDMYVDDLLSGAPTTKEAISLYHQLTSAVTSAGLEMRKWSSNDQTVLNAIPEGQRETDPTSFDTDQTIKALGIQWSPSCDKFTFKHIEFLTNDKLTKRQLLADLSRIYDPLGFITPVTIRAKLLLQELWKLAVHWDEPVSASIQQQWKYYCQDLRNIDMIKIPRRITCSSASQYQLHGFSDASERAYGAVVYLRIIKDDGSISCNLVTSKSRVTPIKQVTLPRLELCSAVLLCELLTHVHQVLGIEAEMFCWSDSTITLRWIASNPRRWKTFVANRVARIQELTPVECWRHVPGTQNPADLPSRGTTVQSLCESTMWWSGPSFLSELKLPVFTTTDPICDDLEERNLPILAHTIEVDSSIINRFSSLTRLKRVVAIILRLSYNAKKVNNISKRRGCFSPSELQEALLCCVKIVQKQFFDKEIGQLRRNQRIMNSTLRQLNPYLDSNNILRVGGRLQNAQLPEQKKHQIVIPNESHLAYLLIHHVHQQHLHSGFQQTWSSLQTEYWILRGRDKVRFYVRSCVTCRKQRSQCAEQLMGNLPMVRVTPARAFLHTGVDYAGPFTLKNPIGRAPKTYKGYLCLFVCMSTKALHLEAVSSLTTDAFIATLRRFVSRRGLCAHLYSDCGTNFVGAEKELQKFIRNNHNNIEVASQLSGQGISWHFHPPSAPHHGGLWEAGVKSAKQHLRRIMNNHVLTFENFSTILCQVEAVLNSRPLTPLSTDPTDFNVLTPGHFLIGEPLTALPDSSLLDVKINRLNQYQQQQRQVQHFWKRWSMEYLNTLQQRNKWFWEKTNVTVGEMVLIKEETSPGSWKIGRIIQVYPGSDGLIRVAKVKTATNEIERPIVKLMPLFNDKQFI